MTSSFYNLTSFWAIGAQVPPLFLRLAIWDLESSCCAPRTHLVKHLAVLDSCCIFCQSQPTCKTNRFSKVSIFLLKYIRIIHPSYPICQVLSSPSHSQHVRLSGSARFKELNIFLTRFRKLRSRTQPDRVTCGDNHRGGQWQKVDSPGHSRTYLVRVLSVTHKI